MDDETAEIELVSIIYNHFLLAIDRRLLVTTKLEQDTTVIEANDQYGSCQLLSCWYSPNQMSLTASMHDLQRLRNQFYLCTPLPRSSTEGETVGNLKCSEVP